MSNSEQVLALLDQLETEVGWSTMLANSLERLIRRIDSTGGFSTPYEQRDLADARRLLHEHKERR